MASEITSKETDMMVRGDELACVHTVGAAMPNGAKWETPIACIYKFKGPKIQRHKLHFDRLSVAKQTAVVFKIPM
jgi:predicted ester cyclase